MSAVTAGHQVGKHSAALRSEAALTIPAVLTPSRRFLGGGAIDIKSDMAYGLRVLPFRITFFYFTEDIIKGVHHGSAT
jgi:hypothetical protein